MFDDVGRTGQLRNGKGHGRGQVGGEGLRERLTLIRRCFDEFDDQEKTLALAEIFPSLGPSQFHWLSLRVPRGDLHFGCASNCTDFLCQLPLDVVLKILEFLPPESLVQCAQVCKQWNQLLDSDVIWQRLCYLNRWRLSPSESQEQIERRKSLDNGRVNWKAIFKERYRLRRCWLAGQCHVRTFEGHTGGVSCVQFDGSRIVSGSHDKTIRVWNRRTNSPWSGMTLTGHSGEVRCIHLEGNRIVSGSTDMTIKVWDLAIQPEWSSIGCRVTMVGHTDTVRCVHMKQSLDKVVSGSYDACLKVWCLRTGECLDTMRGHTDRVLCLDWEDDKLISGAADMTIKLWCMSEGNCLQTLTGHTDSVTCLSREGKKIISGSLDRTIKMWHLDTGQCLSTLDWMSAEGHTGVIRCLQADRWRIVSSSDDKTLKVWCLDTGQRLVTLRSHTDGVTCLSFDEFVIVSGSYDKTVKLWDFTVC